jgi:hypothetical protein
VHTHLLLEVAPHYAAFCHGFHSAEKDSHEQKLPNKGQGGMGVTHQARIVKFLVAFCPELLELSNAAVRIKRWKLQSESK